MTRIASLNAEIETFKAQCARLQQAENASKATLSERLLPTLSELRQDLRAIETEFQQLAPRQEEELQARRQEKAQEIAALEGKAHSQSDTLEEQRRRHAERMDEVEQKYVVSHLIKCVLFASGTWRHRLLSRHLGIP
jgi:chromosome segregation ATPase